jgi:Pyruvate/2-oxoacid:ferredoxin oxidoreductase delta subunit
MHQIQQIKSNDIMKYQIDQNRCASCMTCLEACPTGAIQALETGVEINHQICKDCGICAQVCPVQAIEEISEKIPVNMDVSGDTQSCIETDPIRIRNFPVIQMISPNLPQGLNKPVWNDVVKTNKNPGYIRSTTNGCKGGRGCGKRNRKRKKWY